MKASVKLYEILSRLHVQIGRRSGRYFQVAVIRLEGVLTGSHKQE